jgi:hypothetical protein
LSNNYKKNLNIPIYYLLFKHKDDIPEYGEGLEIHGVKVCGNSLTCQSAGGAGGGRFLKAAAFSV